MSHAVSKFTEEQFKEACGVGIEVSLEQIEQTVRFFVLKKVFLNSFTHRFLFRCQKL